MDKATGALQASLSGGNTAKGEGEGEEEGGIALSAAERAAVAGSMRDAKEGWYRLRALGADGRVAAMTSVSMVRC